MNSGRYTIILEKSYIITGEENKSNTAQQSGGETTSSTGTPNNSIIPGAGEPNSMLFMIGAYAVILGALWFFMIRPQRKREKQAREMQEALRPGDNVVTTGGLFGKITDVGDDSFIIEIGVNRGVRVPIRKSDVLGVKEPKLTPPPAKE